MNVFLNRRYHFSASHRLHAESLSPEENASTFGKCNNPHGHGHNYIATIRLSGQVDPATGMVANLADLDRFAEQRLLSRFHLVNLNTLAEFGSIVPTTENLAIEVHRIFSEFPQGVLESVNIEETPNNSFIYITPSIYLNPDAPQAPSPASHTKGSAT
jgi:6-pyruvoyltetrahydropterin/6-carboxytetrahydropterin synthase